MMKQSERESASQLFGVLSNPTRLRVMELICESPHTVNEVSALMHLPQPTASQHLSHLHRAGLLSVEPRGTCRYYHIRGPRIASILQLIQEFCSIHNLDQVEKRMDAGDEYSDESSLKREQ